MLGDAMNRIAEEPDVCPSHKSRLVNGESSHGHVLSILLRDSSTVVRNKIPGLAEIDEYVGQSRVPLGNTEYTHQC